MTTIFKVIAKLFMDLPQKLTSRWIET